MASSVNLPPTLLVSGRQTQTILGPLPNYPVSATKVKFTRLCVPKAVGGSSQPSTSLSVVKSVQNVWDKSEDRIALVGLGFASIVALWASTNLVTAIDKVPIIPNVLELVGILFSTWFVYRYLLLKPDREELFQIIKKYVSDIIGQ